MARYVPCQPSSVPSEPRVTYRQEPPGRRSMSHTTRGASGELHHRRTRSGLVHARKTSGAGASNWRVMRISRSEGRVTTAEPWRVDAVVIGGSPFVGR